MWESIKEEGFWSGSFAWRQLYICFMYKVAYEEKSHLEIYSFRRLSFLNSSFTTTTWIWVTVIFSLWLINLFNRHRISWLRVPPYRFWHRTYRIDRVLWYFVSSQMTLLHFQEQDCKPWRFAIICCIFHYSEEQISHNHCA